MGGRTGKIALGAAVAAACQLALCEDAGQTGVHGYTPKGYVEATDPAVKENIERFRDMKLGLMMHFGIYSQVGIDESWPLVDAAVWRARQMTDMGAGDDFKRNYWNLAKTFNPIRFDADAWARAAATNGFKYLCFTTKHHDGFSMFDTKYSDYKITSKDCPYSARPNADMVRDIWDAFRRRGLAISCYFSKADWHHEDYWEDHGIGRHTTWYPTYLPKERPEKWARFERFMRNQMLELCRDYGRIEVMWLDGAVVGCRSDTRVDMSGILAECRKYQPWLIAADRSIGGPNQQLITPEQTVPEKPMACPWESCITMASNWSYRFDDEYKSAKEIIQMLVGIVAKGGCLVLNVAPRPDGVIPQPALERMNAMGAWLRANGSAIYASRPFPPYAVRNWCFTQRAGRYYAIRLTRDGERDIQQMLLNDDKSKDWNLARVFHVASGAEIPFERTPDGWLLRIPKGFAADPYADAFELVFADGNGCASAAVRPGPTHAAALRRHTGIPSLAVSPRNGRLWATFYGGVTPGEDSNSYVPLMTSADGGKSWKTVCVAEPETGRRVFDPELWVAPDGKLRWTYTSRACRPNPVDNLKPYGGDEGDVKTDRLMMAELDAEGEPPAPPAFRQVAAGVMMCKPTVLRDGTWLLPVAHWRAEPSACFYASTDGGKTFALRGGVSHFPKENRLYDEHTVVELGSGDLLTFIRAKKEPTCLESVSHDGGRTWTVGKKARFGHTSSRHFLRRLKSGNLLLVKNGPIDKDVGRKEMTAFVSTDDGATWKGGLVLDARDDVSYPDGDQAADGTIYVVYDHDRLDTQEVLFAAITEDEVLAGKVSRPTSVLRGVVVRK